MDPTQARTMVASLREERDAVRRQIDELEARCQAYDKTITGLVELYFPIEQLEEAGDAGHDERPSGHEPGSAKTLREYIEEFFDLHRNEWVTTREIHDGVVRLGWTTKSKNSISVLRNTLGPIVQADPRIERKQREDQQMLHRWVPENAEGPVAAGPSDSANPLPAEGGDSDGDHRADRHRAAVAAGAEERGVS